ncbi:flavin monoamine oxidase family protein [Aquiflexum gelatinilyticum]|uniref:flavin monoamine oxidase family protein n=1 Tax=Aquiflexum gelatinilyticum TaxID=2961943 RepID=UPI00216992BC|nr:NAD(P)/FAD-dependent oxidoreductase [Aquiflexum gelatinilyticum]MCS4433011.1 FAD-dependent oxidoreductase [Aquiflexum gelatinilyticum]
MREIIVIGAGLSGLTVAYNLRKRGIFCKVLEAQDRIGGRIQTVFGKAGTPMEMGATWFGDVHVHLLKLLQELEIGFFKQKEEGIALFETMSFEPPHQYYIPASESSSYRVQGGTSSLISALAKYVREENIILNMHILEISEDNDQLILMDQNGKEYLCHHLVVAMPPRIFAYGIKVHPELPKEASEILQNVQTWMSGSVKFAVEYASPFWREKGFSGNVYSQSGLATEIYDHTDFEESKFALKGFLNGSASHFSLEERKKRVIQQLVQYYGHEAAEFLSYTDKIWDDKYVKSPQDGFLLPHQNNGHPIFNGSFMEGKLFLCGAETAKTYGGYMDGAVKAAHVVSENLFSQIL